MPSNNDSSVTETHYKLGRIRKLVFEVLFDSGDGSLADHTITSKFEGQLLDLVTNPGSTAPSNLYDITIEDPHGHDVLEGVGANRATATTEKVVIVYSGTGTHPTVDDSDTHTLKIANNSVNSATTEITLYYGVVI